MEARTWALAGALCAALSLFQPQAVAQSTSETPSMTSTQVAAKLQAAGYTGVRDVRREGDHFDANAMKDGKTIHVHVDAKTGAITPAPKESEEDEEHERH
jgi:predicted aspartyl protease